MSKLTEVRLPDIGDFDEVEIIEILVAAGDIVEQESSLITLESDKATMEIPSPAAGAIKEILVSVGDKISEGTPILLLEEHGETATSTSAKAEKAAEASTNKPEQAEAASAAPAASSANKFDTFDTFAKGDKHAEVLVLGSGPGGYTTAFRAADLGKQVIMIERHQRIGGVCLNVGCIPSKALLHSAAVITEAEEMESHCISFGNPHIDIKNLSGWKDTVFERLTAGLKMMAKQRKF